MKFDVKNFIAKLRNILRNDGRCTTEYKPILMESYVGLPALVHNYSQIGYYKVRGKVSF